MVFIRVDPFLSDHHTGYVTCKTLCSLKLLHKQWISVSTCTVEKQKRDGCSSITEELEKKQDVFCADQKPKGISTGDEVVKKNFALTEQRKNWYVLQICQPNDHQEYVDGVIYVSPPDLFNIVKGVPTTYKKLFSVQVEIVYEALPELSIMRNEYRASKTTLSLVSCPFKNAAADTIDDILKEHFEQPRLLSANEIFGLRVSPHHVHWQASPYLVWFRVETCDTPPESSHVHQNNARFVSSDSELILTKSVTSHVAFCPCTVKNRPLLFDLFMSRYLRDAYPVYMNQLNDSLQLLETGKVSTVDATILVEAPTGYGKGLLLQIFCVDRCLHFVEEDCLDLVCESFAATERCIRIAVENARTSVPCLLYLKNIQSLCKDKDGEREERRILNFFTALLQELKNHQESPLLIVASTTNTSHMTSRFYSLFMYHLCLDTPTETERECLLNTMFNCKVIESKELATKTSGFVLSDFVALFKKLNTDLESHRKLLSIADSNCDSVSASELQSNFLTAVEEIRVVKSGTLTNVKVEKITWSDVGGLEDVKKDIFDTIDLPMKFPHLFHGNMRRSGLLFYGPPGCGKTLLAKAIATEFSLNFYSVKGPELINMYVGQSEENVRETFKTARRMAPCVVFFDEIDSLAPNRGRSGDSGGVMDRIVSQLLSELDGMHDNTDVFIIAATNRPDLLDPALLRPGRFDKLIYIGIPEQKVERLKLLKAVTRKIELAPDVCLDTIVDEVPPNLTGADFKALASDSVMCCLKRLISEHETSKKPLNKDEAIVTLPDVKEAIRKCVPSVSLQELQRYKSIKDEMTHR